MMVKPQRNVRLRGLSVASVAVGACCLVLLPNPASAQSVIEAAGAVEAERTMVFGELDGPTSLSSVSDLVVSDEGVVFIAQDQECVIKVVGPEGDLRQTIGGCGRGPGEFEEIGNLTLVGNELHVFDPFLGRRTVYAASDGTRIRDERVRIQGLPPSRIRELHPSGRLNVVRVDQVAGRPQDIAPWLAHWVLLDETFAVLDTLGVAYRPEEMIRLRLDRGWNYSGQPFNPYPVFIPFGERLWNVQRTNGDIVELDLESDTVEVYSVDLPQLRMVRDTLNRAVGHKLDRVIGKVTNARDRVEEVLLVPDLIPALTSARIGSDGVLWLRPRDLSGWFIVSTRTGRRYWAELPELAVRWSKGDEVWGIRHGEFGEPYVERYRLRGGEFGVTGN